MARLELRFGAPVVCGHHKQGSLSGILLHEALPRWEALITRRGVVRRVNAVVPRAALVEATSDRVAIALPAPAEGAEPPAGRLIRAGMVAQLRDGSAAGQVTAILATDDGDVRQIVVRTRGRGAERIAPATCMTAVDHGALTLDLTPDEFSSLPVYRRDDDLVWDVRRTLRQVKTLALDEWPPIRVTAAGGVVTLAGHVNSRLSADEAERCARAVPGVLDVANHLVCDNELEREVARALAQDPRTRSLCLAVRAQHGVVTVSGQAPDAESAMAATQIAAALPAVRGVVNRINAPGFWPDLGWVEPPAIGAEVYAEDGMVGTVERIVIDPRTRRPAGLVVHARVLHEPTPWAERIERIVLVPAERIQTMTDTSVFIHGRSTLRAGRWRPSGRCRRRRAGSHRSRTAALRWSGRRALGPPLRLSGRPPVPLRRDTRRQVAGRLDAANPRQELAKRLENNSRPVGGGAAPSDRSAGTWQREMSEMDMLGRALLLTGLVIALVGVLLMVGARVAFEGRLPGDLSLHWRGVHIYLPLASSLLVSLLLTALLSLLAAWRR